MAGYPKPRREIKRRKSLFSLCDPSFATCLFNLFISIEFPPLTLEQLPQFTNISFKGTNKCVTRLDDIDLQAESINLISNCISVDGMGAVQQENALSLFILHFKLKSIYRQITFFIMNIYFEPQLNLYVISCSKYNI